MLTAGTDQIVLGCTHYPLLIPVIERIINGQARVLDPAQPVARQARRVLHRHNLLCADTAPPEHNFFTTGPTRYFQLPSNEPQTSTAKTKLLPIRFKSVQI